MVSAVNKTYGKSIFRTIKSSLSRFLAILAIVALGVGFLAGLLSSPGDMRVSADHYYDESRMYDARVLSTLGLTEDDLEAVKAVDGVEAVMPVYDTDLVLVSEGEDASSYTTRMHSLPQDTSAESENYLNQLTLVEGRMPEKSGEIVVVLTKSFTGGESWIGQTLRQDPDGEAVDGLPEEFTVVGTVKSAMYLSMENESTTAGSGSLGLLAYTVPESFTLDYYTGFYLAVADTVELDSFSQAYDDVVAAVTGALEPLGEERSQIRYEQLIDDAQSELDDARAEYEGEKADAEAELADAKQKLEDGEAELADSQQQLNDAKAEIDSGWAELNQQKTSFNSQTASAQAQIDSGYAQVQSGQTQLDSGLAQLNTAQQQLDQGYSQLSQTEQTLNDTKAQLDASKAQLDATKSQLDSLTQGKEALFQAAAAAGLPVSDTSDAGALALIAQLEAASPELGQQFAALQEGLNALAAQGTDTTAALAAWEEGNAQYEAGLAQYQEGLSQYQAAKAQLDASQAELDTQRQTLESQQATLNSTKAQLDQSAAQLRQGIQTAQAEFASAEAKLNDAQAQYDDGLSQLEAAAQEIQEGWDDYNQGYEEAHQQFADAEEELADAESKIREIEEGQWYIYTRADNTSFSSYDSNADKIAAIATVFPLFFFLVAALVALTTMTRMVEDQRVEIGGLKALGYSRSAIALKYVGYGFLSSFLGGVLGLAVGVTVIPTIIFNAWKVLYTVGDMELFLLPDVALLSVGTAVLCVTGTAFATCFAALAAVPAQLMRPKSPKPGRRVLLERIRPLWKRMSFTWKVTIRNLFRYKKRFWMTVIGIGGCTALIITGFGVRNSLYDVFDKQYDEITPYSAQVSLMDNITEDELTEIAAVLDGCGLVKEWMPVSSQPVTAESGSRSMDSNVYLFTVSDQEQFSRFVHLRHRLDGDGVSLSQEGAVITEKLADMLDVGVGDTITLVDGDNRRAEVTITDLTENYVFHYLYITEECYESLFGQASEINSLMVTYTDDTEANSDAVAEQLIPLSGVSSVSRIENTKNTFIEGMKGVDYAVVIITVSAAALAFVVLFNLTNINITERMRELATLKVLGFYTGELNAYIYRENIFLTIFGILLGLVLGKFLHQWLIITVEIDMVMFGRDAGVMSYVYAAVLTALFSFLVNVISRKKLKKIDMVESLKTVD